MKRQQGTGSITTLSEGRHLIRWPGPKKRDSKVIRGTYEDAERALAAVLAELAGETSRGHTFRSFGEECLDRWEERDQLRSMAALRSRWRRHVERAPFIGWPIADIRSGDVRRWLDKLSLTMSAQSVRHCAFLVSAVFRDALERELVDRNPVEAVRKPVTRGSRRDIILAAEQIGRLGDRRAPDEIARLIALAYVGTGVRPGELLGLRLEDVRLEGDEPHLRVLRSGRHRDTTKTDQARRVELFGVGLEAVRRWVEVMRARLTLKRLDLATSPWAFPIPPAWLRVRGRVGAAIARAGGQGVHVHDLRGTFASHALTGTFGEPWTIAEVAAHIGDSIETTQRHYAHLVGAGARRAAQGQRKDLVPLPPRSAVVAKSSKKAQSPAALAPVAQLDRALASEAADIRWRRADIGAGFPSPLPASLAELRDGVARAIDERDPFVIRRVLELLDALPDELLAVLEGARRAGGAG